MRAEICIIYEGNEEYEYLKCLKDLKVWNEQYEISVCGYSCRLWLYSGSIFRQSKRKFLVLMWFIYYYNCTIKKM